MTQAEAIRDRLRAGKSTAEIRAELECTRAAIWDAKKLLTREPKKAGRPRKHAACKRCGGSGNEPVKVT